MAPGQVKSGHWGLKLRCPLYAQQRTWMRAARRLMTRSKQAWSSRRSSHHSRVLADAHNANTQTFHVFCRSEVRMSASRSTAGSVNSGYTGRNTASVVMRAALGVDCNEPSAVGTARNWLPSDASKPAARKAVKI